MPEDKQARVFEQIAKIAKDIEYGEFKVLLRVHQGIITKMREEQKDRVTEIG